MAGATHELVDGYELHIVETCHAAIPHAFGYAQWHLGCQTRTVVVMGATSTRVSTTTGRTLSRSAHHTWAWPYVPYHERWHESWHDQSGVPGDLETDDRNNQPSEKEQTG